MAIRKASFELADIVSKLRSREGQELVGELASRVRPSISETGDDCALYLATGDATGLDLPKDRFEHNVVLRLFENVVPRSRLGSRLPAAIAEVLIDASQDGRLDETAIQKKLGPGGLQFVRSLAQASPTTDAIADRAVLEHVTPERKAKLLARSSPPKLPALDLVTQQIAKKDELSGVSMFALQHLFDSTASLFQGMEATGLDLSSSVALGKVYSTNHHTASWLEARGMTIDRASTKVDHAFDATMKAAIRTQLEKMIRGLPNPPETNPKPCRLILDDGAEAIKLLHEEFPEYAPYFFGVEQTRRGARILAELDLKMPVANVAESWAKLEHESPMIGHSVVLEVQKKLDELSGYGVDAGKSAVVLGYGAVGSAVAESLKKRGLEVHVFDPDPTKRATAEKAGFTTHRDLTDTLEHGQVLVSCVGKRTLSKADYDLLPNGAILVNAASANDEISSNLLSLGQPPIHVDGDGYVWSKFQDKPVCLGLGTAEAHADMVVRRPSGKELMLVHHGYVVNMTGERDPIPPRYIQLTRALLFSGAIAAKRAGKPGVVEIPRTWQEAIVKKVQHELSKTKEKLHAPSWDAKGEGAQPVIRPVPDKAKQLPATTIEEALFPSVIKTSEPSERVFGYALGPVQKGTREAYVDEVVGNGDGILSPVEAGLDRALLTVNRHFHAEIAASMRSSSPTFTTGKESSVEERRLENPGSERDQLVGAYSHYLVELTRAALSAMPGGAPPTPTSIAHELQSMLSSSSIPLPAVLQALSKGPEEHHLVARILSS